VVHELEIRGDHGRGVAYIGKEKEKLLELPQEPLSCRRKTAPFLDPSLASDPALPGTVNSLPSPGSVPSSRGGSLESCSAPAAAMASS
jgi:hypothetical protein